MSSGLQENLLTQLSTVKEARSWADQALTAIPRLRAGDAWGDWIAVNGENLGLCEQLNGEAYGEVKEALAIQAKRLKT